MTSLRPWLVTIVLVGLALLAGPVSAARSVPPNVGKYSYGFIRCDTWHDGYANRTQDETTGANAYYNSGCGAHVSTPGPWATDTAPQGGVCGGDDHYPGKFLGVESSNNTNDLVTYNYGSDCSGSSVDGMSIRRIRPVACPAGYTPNNTTNLCDPPSGIDPNKNNADCPAGCNGSDPINSATGALLQNENDYVDPASLLTLTRLYSSAAGQPLDSSLGSQWRTNFDQSIGVSTSGGVTAATAYRLSGDRLQFVLVGTTWTPDADVHIKLTSTSDTDGNYTSWTLSTEDGTVESYNGDGYLTQVVTRDQRKLLYTYDGIYLTKVTDDHGRSLTFLYSDITYNTFFTARRITEIDLPDGRPIKYSYDATSAMLTGVTYPADGTAAPTTRTYIYAENGAAATALTGITDENGNRFSSWTYDPSGRATLSVQGGFADYTNRTELTFTDDGSSSSIKSWTGNSASGATTRTFTFSTVQGVAQLGGSSDFMQLPSAPHLPKAQTFDAAGQPLTRTDFNGVVSKMTYDTNELQTQLIEAFGKPEQRTTNTTWNATLRMPLTRTVMNAAGTALLTRAWIYNATGQLLVSCDIDFTAAPSYVCANTGTPPVGVRRTVNTYCTSITSTCPLLGLLLTTDGPRTDVMDVTTYSYYTDSVATGCTTPGGACHQAGDLYQIKNAAGQAITFVSYDASGRPTRIKDANGILTDSKYTARGWLASSTVDGNITSYAYNGSGQVTKVTDPDGVYFTYAYDNAQRLTRITDALGNYAQYTLDAVGNRLTENTYLANGTLVGSLSRQFDAAGNLVKSLNAQSAATTYGYDADGNLVDVRDPLMVDTHHGLDALHRITSVVLDYNGTNPATTNTSTATAYDALDHVTSVTDANGLSTTYKVNALGDIAVISSPDSGTNHMTFDAAGNLISRLDARGVTVQYSWDALNRLTGAVYPAHTALNVVYTHDQAAPVPGCPTNSNIGHLTTMTDASGSTAWCYTGRGDVRQVRQVINGTAYLQSFIQTAGRRARYVQYPSGFETVIGHDAAGRVSTVGYLQQAGPYGSYTNSTVTPLVTAVTYQPFGAMTGYTWAQGSQSVTLARDGNGWATDVVGTAINLHFALDANGQVVAEGDVAGASPAAETYKYDALGRLTELDNNTGAMEQAFTYNGTGDRLTQATAPQAPVNLFYQTGTHRVSSVGALARAADPNGNTTSLTAPVGALLGLGYDDRNLLTVVQQAGITVGTYQYNGRGERVWRTYSAPTSGQAATVYDAAASGNLFGEYFASDFREYVYLNGIPVASATDAGRAAPVINYLYADHLGSLRTVTTTSGTTVWNWAWKNNGFGNQISTGSASYYLRFPGQYYDVESGLHYNGSRYYDPSTGRYLEQDPLGLLPGTDAYSYVNSNPLTGFDALALFQLSNSHPTWGGALCDHGILQVWTKVPYWFPPNCSVIGQCERLHEWSHVADANRTNPGLCSSAGSNGLWLAPSSNEEANDTETRAYQVELNCLERWLKEERCHSDKCTDWVKARIEEIKDVHLPQWSDSN